MTDLAAGLHAALDGHPFVTAIAYYPRVGSTNDVTRERGRAGAAEGLLVIADEQTAGRGRRGRGWWAPPGSALLTSLLFRPALPPRRVQQLTMLCALAAADAVAATTGLPVDLKWPNDLLVGDRKLAGLLTIAAFQGAQLDFAVVGLGLNVNVDFDTAPPFIAPATSLQRELGHPTDRLALLLAYLDGVARRYARLKLALGSESEAGEGPYAEWAGRLVTLGQEVVAHRGQERLYGLAEGVEEDGALLLRTADGTLHRLHAADVSLHGDP